MVVLGKIYPLIIYIHFYVLIGLRFSTFLAFTICITILTLFSIFTFYLCHQLVLCARDS